MRARITDDPALRLAVLRAYFSGATQLETMRKVGLIGPHVRRITSEFGVEWQTGQASPHTAVARRRAFLGLSA